jgi:GT2 family glycosyltransferase
VFEEAAKRGFKYVVTIDDDMILYPGHMDNLIYAIEDNPQFHAVTGYCVDWKGKRMLGGKIVRRGRVGYHVPLPYQHGVFEADYSSSGVRIVKLDPLILQDVDYTFGFIDFDYSQRIRAAGLKIGVTGDAGGMHKCVRDEKTGVWTPLPGYKEKPEYMAKRLDRESIKRHRELYIKKWNYIPTPACEMRKA